MNHKILKEITSISVGTLILIAGASAMPQDVKPIKTSVVHASSRAEQTRIIVPKGYTADLIEDWKDDPNNAHVTRKLQRLSRQGMISNRFYDQTINDNRKVDLNNLSSNDQYELSQYALTLINSIRTQLGLPKFVYTASAQSFANDIAKAYNEDNWSNYQSHDISAINRVAKQHGLTQNDNEYEDMGGFDITTGAIIFFLFTTLIFTLFLQIYKQSALIRIHQNAMSYIIDICEDIDLQDYDYTEDLQEYKDYIVSQIGLPTDLYNLTLSDEKYIDSHADANDIVKKITINIKYTFDDEERSIEIKKIKVREL